MPLLRNPTPGPSLHRFVRSKRDDKERERKNTWKRQSDQSDIPIEKERERARVERERVREWKNVCVRVCEGMNFLSWRIEAEKRNFRKRGWQNRVKFDSFVSRGGGMRKVSSSALRGVVLSSFSFLILFADDFYVFYISVRVYLSLFANGVRLVRVCVTGMNEREGAARKIKKMRASKRNSETLCAYICISVYRYLFSPATIVSFILLLLFSLVLLLLTLLL